MKKGTRPAGRTKEELVRFKEAGKAQKEARKGVLKSEINPVSEMEIRKELYLKRAISRVSDKKQRAKIINAALKKSLEEKALAEAKFEANSALITEYCEKNNCSRKVARKRMSKERRTKKAA